MGGLRLMLHGLPENYSVVLPVIVYMRLRQDLLIMYQLYYFIFICFFCYNGKFFNIGFYYKTLHYHINISNYLKILTCFLIRLPLVASYIYVI